MLGCHDPGEKADSSAFSFDYRGSNPLRRMGNDGSPNADPAAGTHRVSLEPQPAVDKDDPFVAEGTRHRQVSVDDQKALSFGISRDRQIPVRECRDPAVCSGSTHPQVGS